ncbi:MAG: translocation/assembly module TamB [Chitinophagaceae bacterium]|nr:translocation/assembly module TamB [Chitinophagaceae bacterium]
MKKALRILRTTALSLLAVLLLLWLLLQTPWFQQWLTNLAATQLSKTLGTTVQVKRAYVGWLNRVYVEGVLVQDQQRDTLASVGRLRVHFTDWLLAKDTVTLQYLYLQDVRIKLQRNDSIWRHAFLSNGNKQETAPIDTTGHGKSAASSSWPVKLQLELLEIDGLHFEQHDRWRGKSLVGGVAHLRLKARTFDTRQQRYVIDQLTLDQPEYREFRRDGLWSAADSAAYWRRVDSLDRLRTFPESWNPGGMALQIADLQLRNGVVEIFNRHGPVYEQKVFDERDIIITPINGQLRNVRLDHDTLFANANLTAAERSGLNIRRLRTRLRIHPQLMEFADLDLRLNESTLGPYYAMRYRTLDDMEYFVDSVRISARLRNSSVSMNDIAFFAPELRGIRQTATLSGDAEGTISSFFIKNVDLRTGASRLVGDYSMQGLTDIDKTKIKFSTAGSEIALEDVLPWAPELAMLKNTPVGRVGKLRYTGTYEGTVFDFVANGQLATDVGSLSAQLRMRLKGKNAGFESTISNARLNGGLLLGVPDLGMMLFDGKVSSNGLGTGYPILMEGKIRSVAYKGYTYEYINADAKLIKDQLSANLAVNDKNLTANFNTFLDFTTRQQSYNARGAVAYADLHALKLSQDSIKVSGLFDVNFYGENIDDFRGYARIYDAEVYDKDQLLNLDSLYLESTQLENGDRRLRLATNEADATLTGRYNISQLPGSFRQFLHRYYPSVIDAPKKTPVGQQIDFDIVTRNVEPFLQFVDRKLKGLNYSKLSGHLNTNYNELYVDLNVPFAEYDGIKLLNTAIKADGTATDLQLLGSIEQLKLNDSLGFPNAELLVSTVKDTTELRLTTRTNGPLGNAAIGAFFYSKPTGFELRFDESSFILNNKKWTLVSDGTVEMRRGFLIANGIELTNDNQRIKLYTKPSDDGYWNDVYVDVKNLILGDILPFVVTEPRLEGLLNSNLVIQDPMEKPVVDLHYNIDRFYFNNDSIGVVGGKLRFDAMSGKLAADVDSRNPGYDFSAALNMRLGKAGDGLMDASIDLRREKISVLRKYLDGILADLDGYASGQLRVVGDPSAPAILGKVRLDDAYVKVDYTQCLYRLDTATLVFGNNFIDFGSIRVRDERGRPGVMEGRMYHRFFDSLSFGMKMRTTGMQLLNTRAKDNDLFYGQAVGRASFDLYGPLSNLQMRINGATTDTSHIFIANKAGKESGTADFIVFKEYGKLLEAAVDSNVTNMHIELDLTATPLCQIDVIMDELTGDVITATGNGNLKISTGTVEETVMRGRYQIEKGNYNFSFQTLIKKPFELQGGDNNYIEWNGDPLDANLNLTARYTANSVSLRDLMAGEQSQSLLDQAAQSYKGDVYVNARLRGQLSKPEIDFSISFPQGSPMQNNVSVQQVLRRIDADKSEMLRQVTYLIVFKAFAPYKEGIGARNPGTDLAVNTISDLLSNQMGKILTNFIQDITGDRSLNIDFSTELYNSGSLLGGTSGQTATGYDRVNFNFMLNRSYFNNRVVVNVGSDFDLNVRNTTTTGFQFLPDVSVEFILTNNRRLRAIVFKKDALDFAGRRNRAGVSLSYRKEFEKLFSRSSPDDALIFLGKGNDDD